MITRLLPRTLLSTTGAALISVGLLLPATAAAAALAEEPFTISSVSGQGYFAQRNIGASDQNPPPPGSPFASWLVQNQHVLQQPEEVSLFRDNLATSGGKLRVSGAGLWVRGALKTAAGGPFATYQSSPGTPLGSSQSGTVYVSFLFQLTEAVTSGARQNWVQFADPSANWANRLQIGQNWGTNNFSIDGVNVGPIDTNTHLVVVRFDFQPGNDRITGWWNPDPNAAEAANPHQVQRTNANRRFGGMAFLSQGPSGGIFVDEIRFGSTWESVVPTTGLEITTSSVGAGTITRDPPQPDLGYEIGQEVTLTAVPANNWHFSHWSGTVSGFENPITVEMTIPHEVTAHFANVPLTPFVTAPDPYDDSALLDLRPFNEPFAGSKGWIVEDGQGGLIHEDTGEPVRFWTVNAGVAGNIAAVREQARFFAKRGVNHVRWHTSIYSNNAPSFAWFDAGRVAEAQRMVAAHQDEGIYTSLSYFFVLGLRIPSHWGVPGYTSTWITQNPGPADRAPFGLMFFEPMFKDAIKAWLTGLLTTPNPYDDGRPLAENPAVAIVEILNEDNVFFHTFNPGQFPPEQQHRIYGQFGDFVAAKYGSIPAAFSAWQSSGGSAAMGGDNLGEGRLQVIAAWEMGQFPGGNTARNRRIADQIEFLANVQRDFFAEMTAHIRDLGYQGPVTASNWTTSDEGRGHLLDIEHWTYAKGAGVVDVHNYYNALGVERSIFTRISGGDRYVPLSAINAPRRMPAVYRHLRGHASFLSESTWTQPNDFRAEAALLTAAFGAVNGLDGFTWFSAGSGTWQEGVRTWKVWTPNLGGLFPGAALIYRRGDVTPGPVVVRESKNIQRSFNRERSFMGMTSGYDPTRDAGQDFNFDPDLGTGRIDSLAFLTGRAELDIGPDREDSIFVHPALGDLIDNENRVLRSLTGELELHWGEVKDRIISGQGVVPGQGRFTINTPRSQGAAGFLNHAGPIDLDDVRIVMNNEFGSVLVTALDHRPISQSSRLLVQVGTRDQLTGYRTVNEARNIGGNSFIGKRIESVGSLPFQIERPNGHVVLTGTGGAVTGAWNLDSNGYIQETNTTAEETPAGWRISLPPASLYLVVDLEPPAAYTPVITTAALPTGERGTSYTATAEAISGTPPLSWSATGLPAGLSLAPDGTLSGTPFFGGLFEVSLTVTDTNSHSHQRTVSLAVIPTDDAGPQPESYQAWRQRVFHPADRDDDSVSGFFAAPAGDNVANGFKYALGLSPYDSATIELPAEIIGDHLHVSFTRSLIATEAELLIQTSQNLADWSTDQSAVEVVSTTPDPDGLREHVTVRIPLPAGEPRRLFARLGLHLIE
ncbi:MAG: hypothetical protein EA425_08785 [Puniceicoccaceae bacterium]|nr:MAG: hypothetical protein EA425_08785 [Puniceicoccaceae bacterium]